MGKERTSGVGSKILTLGILKERASLGPLHTTAEGQEAVDFHQLDCKKPRIPPLDLSH